MRLVKNQGETKDEPSMNLRTPDNQMCILLRLVFPKEVSTIPKKVDSLS
jgi:hypothetical protein